MKAFMLRLGIALGCLLIVSPAALFAQAAKPNIILIMADDFGYECVGANGGQSYKTPNIDSLAKSGVRFENCHVQPLCTPTRVELMTGRHNVRNYIRFGVLPRTETTFAQVLKKAGYTTGICGKWQLGQEVDSPRHFGFDESCLWQHTRRPPRYANPGLEYNGVEKDFNKGEYGPKLVNDFALDFISRHKDQPFFLYYPMMLTHNPFQPTPDSKNWDPKTMGEKAMDNKSHFADMTAYMDKMIGQVVEKLDALKLRENTLILFLGDNGTGKPITSRFQNADFPGGKGSTNHRGTHVPCIANWPAVIRQGNINQQLISATDFLPTICDAASVAKPSGLDGISFISALKGGNGQQREWLYSWYSPRQNDDKTVRECAWDHHYKLYRSGQFFDLRTDRDEKSPLVVASLSGDAGQAAKKLQAALEQFKNARPKELDADTPLRKKAKK